MMILAPSLTGAADFQITREKPKDVVFSDELDEGPECKATRFSRYQILSASLLRGISAETIRRIKSFISTVSSPLRDLRRLQVKSRIEKIRDSENDLPSQP